MQTPIRLPPITETSGRKPLWPIHPDANSPQSVPVGEICEKGSGTCCKDLNGEDDRHLISPEIIRDV